MRAIAVIGAGKIGKTIAELLRASGDFHVTVADRDAAQLAEIEAGNAIATSPIDISDAGALDACWPASSRC